MPATLTPDTLPPEVLREITGKRDPAAQAAALARRGVPFVFSGRLVHVVRAVAEAHAILPARKPGGVDFGSVR